MPVIEKIKQALHSNSEAVPSAAAEREAEREAKGAPVLPTTSASESPVFDHRQVTVIFVLGGPGVGKGTQCERLVADYGFKHLSAGDLLRAEQTRPDSTYGAMIKEYITEGKIVPMEVTVKLLENAMRDSLASPPTFSAESPLSSAWQNGKGRFLIDGFPRKMDQAVKFDETVCLSTSVLFFTCTEEVMLERLMERGKTSGRDDDNKESIVKRFRTFEETSMPVVDYYRKRNKVVEVDATFDRDTVYANVQKAIAPSLATVA